MTVVRRATFRRWLVVLGGVALLGALPTVVPSAVAAWSDQPRGPGAEQLRELIRRSNHQPHLGYVESTGRLGLPAIPRLGQIAALLSGTTRMRAWYAEPDRWRVDVVDTGAERGLYQTPEGSYTWDYGANQLTHIAPADPVGRRGDRPSANQADGVVFVVASGPSARLPRAADLMPPDLARRLVSAGEGDRVGSIPGKRVAGIAAAGLRLTSADPHTLVDYIDIWADPRTGLPLQVEVTARGGSRPIFVTRFLDVDQTAPAPDTVTPPARREGVQFTNTDDDDSVDSLVGRNRRELPEVLAGQPRRDPLVEEWRRLPWQDGQTIVIEDNPVGVYGSGLSRFVVLPLSNRVGNEAYRGVQPWGQAVTYPGGTGVLLSTSLLSLLVVDVAGDGRVYLVAGLVDADLLRQVGAELASGAIS